MPSIRWLRNSEAAEAGALTHVIAPTGPRTEPRSQGRGFCYFKVGQAIRRTRPRFQASPRFNLTLWSHRPSSGAPRWHRRCVFSMPSCISGDGNVPIQIESCDRPTNWQSVCGHQDGRSCFQPLATIRPTYPSPLPHASPQNCLTFSLCWTACIFSFRVQRDSNPGSGIKARLHEQSLTTVVSQALIQTSIRHASNILVNPLSLLGLVMGGL